LKGTLMTIPLLENRRIILGVTGSIAAYKSAELASMLTQAGTLVDVVLTEAGQRFVSALTFQSLTGRHAYTDSDLWGEEGHIVHVRVAEGADLLMVAPATANTIAKLAHGQADSLLAVVALAAGCPLLIAPAMDAGMYANPATQANVELLRSRGAIFIGPVEGRMASGMTGLGRMAEPEELLGHIRLALGQRGALSGRKVVVTAGGTHEPIDPVRELANRSSGKQGFALAQAAIDRGAEVILIAGPAHLPTPVGARRVDVHTAAEMRDAVLEAVKDSAALIMAAAVADFRPVELKVSKIKRRANSPQLVLEKTDDILGLVMEQRAQSGAPQVVIGFAAESEDLVANARAKLEERGLSMIVANDITATDAGFEVDTNRVALVHDDGGVVELPLMSKAGVADIVLNGVVRMLT
jgi:phosphopantothenoylcysteine decarboxylase/phosphopantothenate--cysteine ligase